MKFGKISVLADDNLRSKNRKILYLCQCECGTIMRCTIDKLKSGHTKSCGCLSKSGIKIKRHIHYHRADEIIRRCTDVNSASYHNYGGRGIKCLLGNSKVEVIKSLSSIPGYFTGAQIGRIDNNGDYTLEHPIYGAEVWEDEHGHKCLGNLRWVTVAENAMNKRTNVDLNSLAKIPREPKDALNIIKRHNYSPSEFYIKLIHNEKHNRYYWLCIHKSLLFNDICSTTIPDREVPTK